MSGLVNIVNLPTYLSTVISGGPATTAVSMINTLQPISYNYGDEALPAQPHYGFDFTVVNSDSVTQSKFIPLLSFSGGGAADGMKLYDLLTLSMEAVKEVSASVPVVPAGPGFLAQNGSATIFDRVFQAGQNIGITIPDGSTGNPVFSFNQAGTTTVVSYPTAIKTFTASNDILFWTTTGGGMWEAGSLKPSTTLLRMDDTLTTGCAFHGSTATSWDTNGKLFNLDMGTWGSTTQTSKANLVITTSETNTNPVVAGNNQGLADFKNILLLFHQIGNSTTFSPALALANQRYKVFSLLSDTGGLTGDFTGEVAYLRGDGTFAGRAFNIVSTSDIKKEIRPLDFFFHDSKTSAGELVDTIQPISFLYKGEEGKKHYGFLVDQIHHESEAEFPELKTLLGYREGKPQSLQLAETLALLFQAFKDLKRDFETLRDSKNRD